MTQITSGVRSVLSVPLIYSSFQYVMGAKSLWKQLANQFLDVKSGMMVLDIGCGPADLLQYLPTGTGYWGVDISENYIAQAKQKYGDRGWFECKLLQRSDLTNMPKFDRVVLMGVLHHLDDSVAKQTLAIAYEALKAGGKLVTIDPCFTEKQNPLARFLISQDRGQNVRNQDRYQALIPDHFSLSNVNVVHRSWIPYTHCFMECTK